MCCQIDINMIATLQMPPAAAVIEAALEGLVRVNLVLMASGIIGPFPHDYDVVYRLEPDGEEDWKHGANVIRDGWGDCEDIAAWCAAGVRFTDEDPDAKAVVMRTGPTNLHCVVLLSNGLIWDPSLDLGMRTNNRRRGVRKG